MNNDFTFFIPTKILFGPGKVRELASMTMPGKKALVVISAGKSMRANGYLDTVLDGLQQAGAETVVFDKILPNPVSEHVAEGAQLARSEGCDFVVGLGGGSSIDSAKSIAVMAVNPGEYWDYINGGTGGGKPVENGALPVVAIPTTAGTGTEADPWTVITNTKTQEKVGFGLIPETFPVFSIVDPELMATVPPRLTAFQGMDAFFHAAEGYIATCSQPASDAFALESMRLINEYLPRAVKDGSDMEARSALAWASTQSGLVESTSSCTSEHSMEHALSAFHPDLPHGAGLILLSTAYFSFMAEKKPERFPAMARAMGVNVDALPANQQATAFVPALKRLIENIGLADMTLEEYGIDKSEAPALADNAMTAMGFLFTLDPYTLSRDEVITIFENSFSK
ncbi:iron-containing alcohol dehydrogenase [Pseudodesulfovibrio senegalensis]|jgi:alcohol dehydrogenase|uniref:Iron-containing alcohol dehydrogenase n=1 Tax=Pseudodesulfovibrio senegalensis TaxID=1721087 RepID=A0A6N6N5E6_9BACT|nr:iron-containing alcohol dehydrogenase [Pseudodesulfovibrio senegalensis]KAB1442998.1 iron-containing alcohol dehydrogenase [Pseudodesulfovibrio senegalensis]